MIILESTESKGRWKKRKHLTSDGSLEEIQHLALYESLDGLIALNLRYHVYPTITSI